MSKGSYNNYKDMVPYEFVWIAVSYILVFILPLASVNAAETRQSYDAWKVKGVIAAWRDPDPEVLKVSIQNRSVQQAVAYLGEMAKEYAPGVAMLLNDPDVNIRRAAMQTLGNMGQSAKDYVPALIEGLKEGESRRAALNALLGIGEPAADQLVELLNDSDEDVRLVALRWLRRMGEREKKHAPRLIRLLKNSDGRIAWETATTLAHMGEAAVAAQAPALLVWLQQKEEIWDLETIAWLFGHMGAGGSDVAPMVARLLTNSNESIQERGAFVLGHMGDAAVGYLPQLSALLKSPHGSVREAAAWALGAIQSSKIAKFLKSDHIYVYRGAIDMVQKISQGMEMAEFVPDLVELLTNYDPDIRKSAFETLLAIPGADEAVVERVIELLGDGSDSRDYAARILEAAPLVVKKEVLVPRFVNLLADRDGDVRHSAVVALGRMGDAAKEQVPEIAALLRDPNKNIRETTAYALGFIGEVAKGYVSQLAELLKDPESEVRLAAIGALGMLGQAAKNYAPQLAAFLNDPEEDFRESATAAIAMIQVPALTALLKDPKKYTPYSRDPSPEKVMEFVMAALKLVDVAGAEIDQGAKLAALLKSPYKEIRWVAATALGVMGKDAKDQSVEVAAAFSKERYEDVDDQIIREAEVNMLGAIGPLDPEAILQLLNGIYLNISRTGDLRFLAHFLAGGEFETETLVQWLGRPKERPLDGLTHEQGVATLEIFKQAWPLTADLPEVRKDLQGQIAAVVQAVRWKAADIPLLRALAKNLTETAEEAAVRNVIASVERTRWTFDTVRLGLAHAAFWLILIFVYPKSRQIQAIFFWNPWVRRFAGLGYVGFALAWIPYLRSKLFAPFREPLLADAALDGFDPQAYFPDSEVSDRQRAVSPIREAIPAIRGQLVLEGESGLGKTMFLRYLAQRTQRIMVYLPAKKCAQGVVEAIQEKLQGPARDPNFLRTLIYVGALDICIDGLNEVDAETRAKISSFAESNFKGNILMATQPLGWTPPLTATVYIMQPLTRDRIEQFLHTRTDVLPEDATVTGEDYEAACRLYLDHALSEQQTEETLSTVERVLSNPMDLTIVAQMLARGQQPDLFRLQEQQYAIMAAEYQHVHLDQAFPLEPFSERVYQMRLSQQTALPADEFLKELQLMERYKMVLSRQYKEAHGDVITEWFFRHDKIMDFFIVQTFLGSDNDRPQQHLGDPRFRGVYLMLATLMPVEAATVLREQLINYAADTKDHTVSDTFLKLFSSRKAA